MKPIIFGTGVLLSCWIAAPLAQRPAAPAAEPAHKVFVLTGCLEGGAAQTSVLFKLADAAAVGQAPEPSRGGTSPAGARAGTGDSYELLPIASFGEQGIKREELQNHVGKRVEVTVRPAEIAPAGPSSASTDAKVKPEESAPQRYTVIRCIAACRRLRLVACLARDDSIARGRERRTECARATELHEASRYTQPPPSSPWSFNDRAIPICVWARRSVPDDDRRRDSQPHKRRPG